MSNPLFHLLGGGSFGNMQTILQQFNNFRNSFKGDPKQEVQRLLNSGQMSQEQFNRLQQTASQLMLFLK